MASHHKMHMKHKRARGGRTEYDAQSSNVMKEAHEMKSGGATHGKKHKHRTKAHGGAVGADKHPFSSAHSGSPKEPKSSPHSGFTGRTGGK